MVLDVIDSTAPLQVEYQPAVNEIVRALKQGLGDNLHSLYLYGSIARGSARPNRSNVDVVVVTHRELGSNKATIFNTIRWRFQTKYSFITDVNIKTALVSEVASLESLFSWGFLLHHCSICLHGDDLGECFGDYEPSWEIAKYWNMDIAERLEWHRDKVAKASSAEQQIEAQQQAAKKLLRAAYGVVMHRDKNWFDDPQQCGHEFLRYYPDKAIEIQRLSILLETKLIPKRSVVGLLDSFGQWLVKEYKKTEFRIG
ncbi:nucleotidyltransferase domain-containing protein [Vibrio sp. RC27]